MASGTPELNFAKGIIGYALSNYSINTEFVLDGIFSNTNDYSPFTPEVKKCIGEFMNNNKEHFAQLYDISFDQATFAARSYNNGTKKAPFDTIGYITSLLRISRRNGRVSDDFWQQLLTFCK
ncbi:hypothetical protein TNCT_321301 [Trichonephila clavata]|uniref:Uncharacterized protein n=1 Tax=Trichonephila clavata TaxID=2740835 RepID=A0A8X6FYV0_TRICU|nr:hypothetical protein TNCT_321301 [Trichonephila clavata]